MSKKARGKKKQQAAQPAPSSRTQAAEHAVAQPNIAAASGAFVPEPEVSTIRLHDVALDDESPSILPPQPVEAIAVEPPANLSMTKSVMPKPKRNSSPPRARNSSPPPAVETAAKTEAPKAPPKAQVAKKAAKEEDDEELSTAFFDAAPNSPSIAPVEIDVDEDAVNESVSIRRMTLTPAGVARRAQLSRYVAAAVGLAALVGIAGAIRGQAMREGMSAQMLTERPALAAAPAKLAAQPVQQLQAPVVQPPPPPPVAEAVKPVEEVKPAEEAKPVEEKKAELDPVQAKKEKNTSRNALESGKHAKAIEAGERSVGLDPTDAEAWLILGVAYQEKGNKEDAKRCFKSCLTEGKRGPKGECAMMAR